MNDATPITFAKQRQDKLLQLVRGRGSIVVRELAPMFGVTELTIRRDINALADRGLVTRVHGGATLPDGIGSFPDPAGGRPTARFTVAMVVPQLEYYWATIIAGVRAAAVDARVRLLLRASSYDLNEDRRQVARLTDSSDIDGLIVAPYLDAHLAESPAFLQWLDGLAQPVVMAERRPPNPQHAPTLEWAVSDHAAGAAMAVRHLHAQGHRRIGLLLDPASPTVHLVREGWQRELTELGIDPDIQLVGDTRGYTAPGRRERISAVLEQCLNAGTTALLIHPDPAALALVQHCVEVGIDIPGGLAVVAYDDEVAALCNPALTAVMPPKHAVGRAVLDLLVARLAEGDQRPRHRISISPVLNVRATSVRPS